MARNDIHAPSNFQPADYHTIDYFGVMIFGEADTEMYGQDAINFYFAQDPSTNPHPDLQQCDLCGQIFNHGAVLAHKDGEAISVGGICMSAIAGIPALSRGQQYNRVRAAQRRRERARKMRTMLAETPGINQALKADHPISKDLRANALKWGSLSERQIELAFKIQRDVANRPPELDPRPVPESDERVRVEGTIVYTKLVPGYMPGSQDEKCLIVVDHDGGQFKLWGTLPKKVIDAQWEFDRKHNMWPEIKGTTIRFKARLERSRDDESFGIYKRPTEIEIEFPVPDSVCPETATAAC